MNRTLDAVIAEIAADPHSAAALTLYALVSTLEHERAGCLFKLDKLRDLSEGQRRLAYALIEMMVAGQHRGDAWVGAKAKLDALIRAG